MVEKDVEMFLEACELKGRSLKTIGSYEQTLRLFMQHLYKMCIRDRIRTYNFPQDRCTDHRIGLTVHNLDKIMDGNLDEIIDALATHEQAEKLRQLNAQAE